MSKDLKEAIRLLFTLADQLRAHDEDPNYITPPDIKRLLREFLVKHGVADPVKAVLLLRDESEDPE